MQVSMVRLGAAAFLLARALYSQEPVKIERKEFYDHVLDEPRLIHSERKPGFREQANIGLQVIVDTNGSVESVRAVRGLEEFYKQAETLEAKRKFRPFERNGAPVRATFSDTVSIVPPEQWAEPRQAFPDIQNLNSLRIQLKRSNCYGPCPAYSVEVQGNGAVLFDGGLALVTGQHTSTLSKEGVQDLLAAFRQASFFSLKNKYIYGVTDNPTYTTSIEFDGHKKTVIDYVGLQAGMPEALRELENAIDRIAGTEKWVKGNSETGAALIAEKWNFSADTPENRALFANVVAHGPAELIQLFLTRGAPAFSMTDDERSAFENAAAKGDLPLVKLMLDGHVEPTARLLSCSLGAAAGSGNLELIRFLLQQGANVNGPPCRKYGMGTGTVLMRATTSGKAEVVEEILKHAPDVQANDQNGATLLGNYLRMSDKTAPKILDLLLAAGADPNERDSNGQPPLLHSCGYPQIVHALIAAGADVNAKDRMGQTALMRCWDAASVRELMNAGADVNAKDQFGRTVLDLTRRSGNQEKLALLEGAELPTKTIK